jgi:hypothetical protein
MDTNFWMLLSISNRSEKVSKNIKFRYLYPVEVRNHGIYAWNIHYTSRKPVRCTGKLLKIRSKLILIHFTSFVEYVLFSFL